MSVSWGCCIKAILSTPLAAISCLWKIFASVCFGSCLGSLEHLITWMPIELAGANSWLFPHHLSLSGANSLDKVWPVLFLIVWCCISDILRLCRSFFTDYLLAAVPWLVLNCWSFLAALVGLHVSVLNFNFTLCLLIDGEPSQLEGVTG